jgi:hypothetical protein
VLVTAPEIRTERRTSVANIPASYGQWPEEQPPDRGDICPGGNHSEYRHVEPDEVGLGELLSIGTDAGVVLQPPCRPDLRQLLHQRPWWLSVAHHVLLEGWAPTWRIAVLVLVVCSAAAALAFASAAMLQTVLGAAGLAALLHRRKGVTAVQAAQ